MYSTRTIWLRTVDANFKKNNNEMAMLESAHRFCLKNMQGFHKRTRTDTVYAMLGFPKIETLINERKILFLRRLCSIPARSSSKQLFTYRLHSYFTMHTSVNSGFIPDVISILDKYELLDYLKTFLACVFFYQK